MAIGWATAARISCRRRQPRPSSQLYGIRVRRRSATAKQLGDLAWWSPFSRIPFIRIIADVALTSDIPVKEYGPDGPYGTQLCGPLDDRLDLRSGDPEAEQPEDGLHDDDGCRDSSNRWSVGQPAKRIRYAGRQGPERHNPQEDEKHTYP